MARGRTRAAALTGAAVPSTFRSERRLEPAWSGSFDHALAAAHQAAGRAISTRARTRRLSCEQADPRPMARMPSAKHDAGALRRRRRSGTPACRYRSRPSRLDRPRRPGTRSARTGCLRGKFVVCRPKSRRSVGLRRHKLPRVVEDSQDFNLPHASPQALGGTGLYWDWTLDWTLELDMHGLRMRLVCSR